MVQLKKPETISIIDNSYGQLKSFYLFVMVNLLIKIIYINILILILSFF